MKLAACVKEIYALLLKLFKEGIVVSVIRQFEQLYFSLPKGVIVQESLAQIHRYHNLLTVEEPGKKESKLLGEIVWRNV
jgi:hypothetical protein